MGEFDMGVIVVFVFLIAVAFKTVQDNSKKRRKK